jgi:hypothetical protein
MENKFYSSKLLNYVESIEVSGFLKTIFYSEINTNLKTNDRIFIVNGNYDSDDYLNKDKYTKYTDGYRVLGADGCRLILDIDYTGIMPYEDINTNNLINVHHITSQRQFDYINSIKIGLSLSSMTSGLYSKFYGVLSGQNALLYTNDIIYVDNNFNGSSETNNKNNGITLGSGFYMCDNNSTTTWIKITNQIVTDNILSANLESLLTNKMYIIGEDINFNGKIYKERTSYKYSSINQEWSIDVTYKQPMLSKLNFRYGTFKGKHNDGIFGTNIKTNNWNSAEWNSGVFINSNWNSGSMNSKSDFSEKSYYTQLSLRTVGSSSTYYPMQTIDFSNNRGFGYNIVLDSSINSGIIKDGNFENCNIGKSSTYSAIDINYGFLTYSQQLVLEKGQYKLSDIHSVKSLGSVFVNSELYNCNIEKSKVINSQVYNSVVSKKSEFNANNNIKIISADLWSYDKNDSFRGVLKLYISDADYFKFKLGDAFYISNVNKDYISSLIGDEEKVLLPIETKYILDAYFDKRISNNKLIVSLKNKTDNRLKYNGKLLTNDSQDTFYSTVYTQNNQQYASIDIDCDLLGWYDSYYLDTLGITTREGYKYVFGYILDRIKIENINTLFTNTYINNADFKSGLLTESTWLSGDNRSYEYNKIVRKTSGFETGNLKIEYVSSNRIYVELNPSKKYNSNINIDGEDIFVNDVIWINSIDMKYGLTTSSIGGKYKVYQIATASNYVYVYLETKDNHVFYPGSTFFVSNNNINENYNFDNGLDYWSQQSIDINNYNFHYQKISIDVPDSYIISSFEPNSGTNYTYVNMYISGPSYINIDGKIFNDENSTFTISIDSGDFNNKIVLYETSALGNIDINFATQSIVGFYRIGFYFNGNVQGNQGDPYKTAIVYNMKFDVMSKHHTTYLSLNKFLIENSTINSGMLNNTGIVNTKIINSNFDNLQRSINVDNVNKLRLINILFKSTNNDINSGLIYKSHFVNDKWNDGIVYNSIWDGGTFSNGIFKSSYWMRGVFNGGSFIDSKSTTVTNVDFDVYPKYRNWLNGTFNMGEFYNSAWVNGVFNNGKFYYSDWYSGIWNNGILGSNNISSDKTTMGYYTYLSIGANSTVWNNGIVDNAVVGGSGSVYWYNGKFNNGVFTSNGITTDNQSIWYNGDFNGGKFSELSKWKDGNFNGGKFLSNYGWRNVSPNNPSTSSNDYGWENGKFNGGEFGDGNMGTNSVWYNGEFNDGLFNGRFWYNGLFNKGIFIGSGTHSLYESSESSIGEFNFVNSYTASYYGLWYNGWVTDNPSIVKSGERVYSNMVRKVDEKQKSNIVNISNMLWVNGTFSHKNATIKNSVWLNGTFVDGTFDSGIFNAYVDRQFGGSFSRSSFASTQSCVWINGKFNSTIGTSSFYISNWKNGTFNSGYMSGATWENGIWNYGSADNIYWINGTWRNGNWDGSPFDYKSLSGWSSSTNMYMLPGRNKDILLNNKASIGTSSIHIFNAFSASIVQNSILTDVNVRSLNTSTSSWYNNSGTYSGIISFYNATTDTYYTNYPNNTIGTIIPIYGTLNTSNWSMTSSFSMRDGIFLASINDSNAYTNGGDNQLYYISSGNIGVSGYNISNGVYSDVPESSKMYAYTGITTSVFTNTSTTYNIKLKISVELTENVMVDFGVGGLGLYTFTFSSDKEINGNSLNYWAKVYDVNFVYNTTSDLLSMTASDGEVIGNKFFIKKKSGGILRLLQGEIKESVSEYHERYNNLLYNGISGNTVSLPNDITLRPTSNTEDGNVVSIGFGNGVFKSGVWENGVWNNGYRSNEWIGENNYYRISSVNETLTYQLDNNTWVVTFNSMDDLNGLSIGDKISIGNISVIEVNGYRRLIKDLFTIVELDRLNNLLKVNLLTNFPIRKVVQDSSDHLIYVSKNIWLSGLFLNGYFKGIWNNGIFKGYPMTTVMSDTHWIDGIFDGGHFISNKIEPTSNNIGYKSGLIQNFEFHDNNKLKDRSEKFGSWMDLNYYKGTLSELYLDQKSYLGTNSFYSNDIIFNNRNLIGYPTFDVMSSKSYFKDYLGTNINVYSLGSKYTKYTQINPNIKFNKPFSNNLSIGTNNFIIDGWTISTLYNYSSPTYSISSNIGSLSYGKFVINGIVGDVNRLKYALNLENVYYPYNSTTFNGLGINRYSVVEIDLDEHTVSGSTQSSYIKYGDIITNIDGRYDNYLGYNMLYNNIPFVSQINVSTYSNSYDTDLIKKRYFYNRDYLSLLINYDNNNTSSGFNVSFNSIGIYEVDMIPFFQYADSTMIDYNIKTPFYAKAPYIDYTDSNFNFIGNINLTFDIKDIIDQQAPSSNAGSYINVNGDDIIDGG